jgi:hypothetical protein
MAGREIVDVAYGEGWDSGREAVLGSIDVAMAAARDAAGQPYAVVLRQRGVAGVVVAHVAWERHYLGLWVYDAMGRRFLETDLRRLARTGCSSFTSGAGRTRTTACRSSRRTPDE